MQRASEVAAVGGENPPARMAQAAWANVRQFIVPGQGDTAQFYNLPGRAVFDALTAALAVLGLAVLLWRVRDAAPLFLLTWIAVMLVPSFLATDRFPTLPRVLGVIPAIYFLPAVGLGMAAAWLWKTNAASVDPGAAGRCRPHVACRVDLSRLLRGLGAFPGHV